MTDVDDRATAPWALPRGPSRRTAVAVTIGGALLITLAVLNSGYHVAYLIGLAAIAVAVVMYRDTSVRTERRRWRQLGLAMLVAGAVGAVAVLTPLLVQRVSAGDHLATLAAEVTDRRLAAAEVGDVLVLVTGAHPTSFSIVETESGSELGRQRVPADRYAIGRGDEQHDRTYLVDASTLRRTPRSISALPGSEGVVELIESLDGPKAATAIDIATGERRWTAELRGDGLPDVYRLDGDVFFVDAAGSQVQVLDGATGEELTDAAASAQADDLGAMIYHAAGDEVHAVTLPTVAEQWQLDVPHDSIAAVDGGFIAIEPDGGGYTLTGYFAGGDA